MGEPTLLLFFGAQALDVGCHHVRVQAKAQAAHARAADLFDDHGRVAEVTARTAPLRVHGGAQQAFASGLEPGFAVHLAVLVPLGLAGFAFTLQKTAHGLAQHFVVLAEHAAGESQDAVHTRLKDGRRRKPALGR